ncbi:alginate lyase family protein [Burkholderia sp. AW33-5]
MSMIFFSLSNDARAFGMFPDNTEWQTVQTIVARNPGARGLLQSRLAAVGAAMNSEQAHPMKPESFGGARTLAYAWRFTGDRRYLDTVKPALLDWAATDQPSGIPLKDQRIVDAAIAIQQINSALTEREKQQTAAWMMRYVSSMENWAKHNHRVDNWMAWALATAGVAATAADDAPSLQWVKETAMEVMEESLFADGSTLDFRDRDALGYHLYDLGALLILAQALKSAGIADLYGWQTPGGGSLGKSLAFVEPYITGNKTHIEFVHTKFPPDITTIHKNQAGKPWQAKQGDRVYGFLYADAFDARWGDWDRKLNNNSQYPHGMIEYLLNQATRESK